MPSKDIKIPGSLHSDQYEAGYKSDNYDDSSDVSDPEEPSAAAAADGNNNSPSHAGYDDTTDSDEYQSDLDPDVPRHPEAAADSAAAALSSGAARKRRSRKRRGGDRQDVGDGAEDDDDSYEASSSSLPAPDELLVRANRLAAKFAARRQWNNAMRQLVRQTALCVLVHGPQHFKYAEAYTELARGYLDYKGPSFSQQAEEHAEHAKNILLGQEESMEGSGLAGTELTRLDFLKVSLLTYHTLGRAQSLMKKFPEAEQSLIKAEKIVQELSKLSIVKHDFLLEAKLKIWTSLAKINAKLNKPMASVSYYEQAIAACEKRYGKGSRELVPLYQGVGATEQASPEFPNHEKAIEMYLKAHEIATAHAKGEFTEEAAGTARSLATAYAKCGDVAAQASAESYMQECLTACLQLYGPEHQSVCEAQDELAKLLIRADKVDEGARLLQENVKVKARVHGDFSAQVLDSYRLLGSLWLSQGRLEKALQDLQRAFDIAEVLHGPGCRICRELQPTIDTVLKHPSMEGKQAGYEMKNRPRFNGIVARSSKTAGGSATANGVFN